jgi:regulatory protein
VLVGCGLRVGQPITPERLEEITAAETLRRAKESAFQLLSYRDRSEKEITDRLGRRGYEEPVIAAVRDYLRTAGYLDDAGFARRWIADRGSSRGRRALNYELRQKGVDAEILTEAMAAGCDVETERASARLTAVKRVGADPADKSREAQAKLAAYLGRRGFGYDTIRPVLAELYSGAGVEAEEFDG